MGAKHSVVVIDGEHDATYARRRLHADVLRSDTLQSMRPKRADRPTLCVMRGLAFHDLGHPHGQCHCDGPTTRHHLIRHTGNAMRRFTSTITVDPHVSPPAFQDQHTRFLSWSNWNLSR